MEKKIKVIGISNPTRHDTYVAVHLSLNGLRYPKLLVTREHLDEELSVFGSSVGMNPTKRREMIDEVERLLKVSDEMAEDAKRDAVELV